MYRPVDRLLRLLLTNTGAALFMVGCGSREEPSPRLGVQNWKPIGIGGPVETRPLPPADRVATDYKSWLSEPTPKSGRVYEAALRGSNQFQVLVSTNGGDTPLGYAMTTTISFLYRDTTNGVYEVFWSRRGWHKLDFLILSNESKLVWLEPNIQTNIYGNPQLKIVAFEGLQPDWGVFAKAGEKRSVESKP